mmetsp:Transcript_54976/g.164692  ORF Transcript_54976/g.164692 Transcript_54976/m.164692 type:complete len:364 (-) Transcript_54976:150-1241(-)
MTDDARREVPLPVDAHHLQDPLVRGLLDEGFIIAARLEEGGFSQIEEGRILDRGDGDGSVRPHHEEAGAEVLPDAELHRFHPLPPRRVLGRPDLSLLDQDEIGHRIALVHDLLPGLVRLGPHQVRDLGQSALVQILQEVHLLQQCLRLGVLLQLIGGNDALEGQLIDSPQFARLEGHDRRRAGAVVQQCQLSEGIPLPPLPHLLPVHHILDLPALNHVEVIPHLPLGDDGLILTDPLLLERLHQRIPFPPIQLLEQERFTETFQQKFLLFVGLGVDRCDEIVREFERSGEYHGQSCQSVLRFRDSPAESLVESAGGRIDSRPSGAGGGGGARPRRCVVPTPLFSFPSGSGRRRRSGPAVSALE